MKNTQISMREVGLRMDAVAAKIADPKDKDFNVNVGTLMVKEFNSLLSAYRLQLDVSRLTGNQIENPLVNMD